MSTLDYAIKRVDAFIEEVKRLKEADFPYHHSKDALDDIQRIFEQKKRGLSGFSEASAQAIIDQECALALRDLFIFTPLLGAVLRSTNVRNAFELYGPLLRLARKVLEPNIATPDCHVRLILSSEWDYSPFMYSEIIELPGLVLIGLPAPEAANPLLIPLAGHELGHSVWDRSNLRDILEDQASEDILDIFREGRSSYERFFGPNSLNDLPNNLLAVNSLDTSLTWLMQQIEESFCDFIGLAVFGEAYLKAFAYLLSPNNTFPRQEHYPKLTVRATNLVTAAGDYGIRIPTGYSNFFTDEASPELLPSDQYLLTVTDKALQKIVPILVDKAKAIISDAPITLPSIAEAERIAVSLKQVVPAENSAALADIINAGWLAYEAPGLWDSISNVNVQEKRDVVLKELLLKNIEIFEIEQILQDAE